ncbi:MAG TPA: aminotransferase class V-fold PLP-dependent enzyme [Burkholderiales bacterium]|nr:aminotransferase class V-fold PLP-dependent enzyme [Burkholderiales bacterium]HYA46199.1 aminotransferase class V-fold PLP-dependent enzyme [Burkholderiales bacterium]
MSAPPLEFAWLRSQVVGIDTLIDTPFGRRPLVYCDYTASGRSLLFIERYLVALQRLYANTHTEDDITGRSMTQLLHEAEASIKRAVNAGSAGRIVACGTGATGAIHKFQEMIGIALAPATRAALLTQLAEFLGEERATAFRQWQRGCEPIVFVGPYEHHSNELSWRHGLASVVEVRLGADGGIDLEHLEELLRAPAHQRRLRIGSFSAASNVTGIRSPVHEIARLLHAHGAFACFDFAACGPYTEIDMNPAPRPEGGDASLDAVFISPHKFLGGPGSSGVLVFNARLYHSELPPTVCGGGTVDYVSESDQDFIRDVETRERAGTPGVLQTLKAALAFELKQAITAARIEDYEARLLRRAFDRWQAEERIEILGNPDPARRIAIVSFNIRDPGGAYLHPKLVTALLNDLFGIQSRAGCSCAGPYGHRLLHIDPDVSEQYRDWVRKGFHGIKPGWCRVGFHFVMDDADADYVIEAVAFIAQHGHRFLPLYDFAADTGAWTRRGYQEPHTHFSLEAALEALESGVTALPLEARVRAYASYLQQAHELAGELPQSGDAAQSPEHDFGRLKFFVT